jgi:simple sugar transport system substrate-binding protein/ribose transport system substrate-binding protein
MGHRRRTTLAVWTIAVAALAVGVGMSAGTAGARPSASGDSFKLADYIKQHVQQHKKLVIRVDYHDPSLAFAVPLRAGVALAAKQLGVDAQLIGPAGGSASGQVSELQTLITQRKVDGIAVSSASNDALKPVIAQAYNAGIPIISFNTDNPDSKQLAFVGEDLRKSGLVEAQQLRALLHGRKGKVVVFSVDTGAGWSHDRYDGFKAGMAGSGVTLVGPINTGNEPAQAYSAVQNGMTANQDSIAIASLDCCSLTAAAKWVQQSGKTGKIIVVGHDALGTTLASIKAGVIQTTISQNPVQQAYQSVKVLQQYLTKGVPIKKVPIQMQVITKKNVAQAKSEG